MIHIRENFRHVPGVITELLEERFDDAIAEHRAAMVLVLGLLVPHALDSLVEMTGYDRAEVETVRARCIAGGVWPTDWTVDALWAEQPEHENAGLAFHLDVLLACGQVERTVDEHGERRYRNTAAGTERARAVIARATEVE